jgi:hypothetical protein
MSWKFGIKPMLLTKIIWHLLVLQLYFSLKNIISQHLLQVFTWKFIKVFRIIIIEFMNQEWMFTVLCPLVKHFEVFAYKFFLHRRFNLKFHTCGQVHNLNHSLLHYFTVLSLYLHKDGARHAFVDHRTKWLRKIFLV